MKRLSALYPTDYRIWHEKVRNLLAGTMDPDVDALEQLTGGMTNPIEACNLFRHTEQLHLLPVAMLFCTYLAVPSLLNGMQRADGSIERLSPEDLQCCLEAIINFMRAGTRITDIHLMLSCPRRCTGNSIGVDALDSFLDDLPPFLGHPFVMGHLLEKAAGKQRDNGTMCAYCTRLRIEQAQEIIKSLWNKLPETFDLSDSVQDWPTI